ncbi:hypothetical protein BCR35DRAFT_301182 [Leucosporidium creatinivorum]|uniref:Small ribosomal subunit protein mS38 n=1 Tax=Leucosporidium creatinivorum TaxID=106004 RepID=A0A1Y2FXP3_9BASI|nr:hypothetical protein BCR35DRAFT_301182 [Leucosporidium creatinivorum]
MVRIHLGRMAPLPTRAATAGSSQPTFFNPSYRALSRPKLPLALSSSAAKNDKPSSMRRCSFSSGAAGGSSSRTGSGRATAKPSTASAPKANTTQASASIAGSGRSAATASSSTTPTLHAPSLPHATRGLVGFDSFFALHRPLLELPIRLHARKSCPSALEEESMDAMAQEMEDAMEGLEISEEAEVMDLSEDGKPIGVSYTVKLSGASRMEPLKSPEEEREMELRQEMDAAEEQEAVLQELEEDNVAPYDAWLIAEPEGTQHPTPVARYLASNQPFNAPARPIALNSLPPSSLSPQTVADLSFLRPHSSAASATPSLTSTIFASQLANPLSPSEAKQMADRFLSSASLTHRWHAQTDYTKTVSEPLELARRAFNGESVQGRRAFEEKRQRGEIRMWSEKEGWTTVDLGRNGEGSPFLPAEMVDLDWEDEQELAKMGGVVMDSVKRKRKKKMTKHKYKKRRWVLASCRLSSGDPR